MFDFLKKDFFDINCDEKVDGFEQFLEYEILMDDDEDEYDDEEEDFDLFDDEWKSPES